MIYLSIRLMGVLAVLSLALPAGASAATIQIPTSFGLGADTHVNLGNASNNNNGGSLANGVQTQILTNGTNNSPNTARPILRFDLSGLPAGTVTDANFTFAARFVKNIGAIGLSIQFAALNDINHLTNPNEQDAAPGSGGWQETGITGNNAPAFNGLMASESILTEIAGGPGQTTENNPAPTFVNFGLAAGVFKDRLVDRLNEDTNDLISFLMVSLSGTGQPPFTSFSFWSKEGADPSEGIAAAVAPTLTVTIDEEGAQAVPVPAAIWLFLSGLAGLGILGRRQRRATG